MIGPSRGTRVLVVDDEPGVASLFARILTHHGYTVDTVTDGPSALASVEQNAPDVVLLDVLIPGADGFEVCRRLKRDQATRLTPVILVTGLRDREHRIRGLEAGADDFLTKPVDTQELLTRVAALARLKRYTDDLDSAASIIMTLAVMIEARDGFGEGHCHRMANYATTLARRLGLGHEDLQALYRGGFLHDIGMLAIPDTVLRTAGPLGPEEFELIKAHTVTGDALCGTLRSLQSVRPIVRHHHERLDGSGYPDGLCGSEIPLLAEIVGLVDVYEAITTQRPYQNAQSIDHAVEVLQHQVNLGWRRGELVEEFVTIVRSGELHTYTGREPPMIPVQPVRTDPEAGVARNLDAGPVQAVPFAGRYPPATA